MYTSIEVWDYSVDMFGNITFEFKGKDSLADGSTETDVNVIGVEGELSGTAYAFGEPFIHADALVTGTQYEAVIGIGTVKEDMDWLVNTSFGSSNSSWLTQTETRVVTVYSPAFMSEFDPTAADEDSEWSESIQVNTTVYDWQNGTQSEVSNDKFITDFMFELDSTPESITTPAGTFDAVVMTVIAENGDRDVVWWSDEADNFVKALSYHAGEDEAYESMTLSSYEKGSSDSTLLIIAVGVAFAIAAAVVLVVVLMRQNRGKP